MVEAYIIFLLIVGGTRLLELRISKRNAAWAMENGGIEAGKSHFKFMALLHTSFLFSCGLEVVFLHRPFIPPLGCLMLALAIGAQVIRFYTISVLGKLWNVRVIVIPNLPVIKRGLYKYIRHPNYLAVIVEIMALPMIHTAWITAFSFTVFNAWMLFVRIRCEERALSENSDYLNAFNLRGRFFPSLKRTMDFDAK
jgi:methyltransferase